MPRLDPTKAYLGSTTWFSSPPSEIVIPLEFRIPLVFPGQSQKFREARGIVDTGATASLVLSKLARELSLPVISRTTVVTAGEKYDTDVVCLDLRLMGGITFEEWHLIVGETGSDEQGLLLGMDIIAMMDVALMHASGGRYAYSAIYPPVRDPVDYAEMISRQNADAKAKARNKLLRKSGREHHRGR